MTGTSSPSVATAVWRALSTPTGEAPKPAIEVPPQAGPAPQAPTRLVEGARSPGPAVQESEDAAKPKRDTALEQSAKAEMARVRLPADRVDSRAPSAPPVQLQGQADPTRMDNKAQQTGVQAQQAAQQVSQAADAPFGQQSIVQAPTDEELAPTFDPAKKLPAIPGGAGVAPVQMPPADVTAQIDAAVAPVIAPQISAEKAKYSSERAGAQERISTERSKADADIESRQVALAGEQQTKRNEALAQIDAHRAAWKSEVDATQVKLDADTQSLTQRHHGEVEQHRQRGQQEAEQHLQRAGTRAEEKKREVQAQADAKKAQADQESGGFWGWVKSKAQSFINGLKAAINALYDGLRFAVKQIFEAAKKLSEAAIEVARLAVVAAIRVHAAALKAVANVALAAFPEIRKRFVARIEAAEQAAIAAVNQAAEMAKKAVADILDAFAKAVDAILGLIQDAYNAALTAIEMLVSGKLAELFAGIGRVLQALAGAPWFFVQGIQEELLEANLDEPLPPHVLDAAGRSAPRAGAGAAPSAMDSQQTEPLPGPRWIQDNVGVDQVATGTLSPEILAEVGDRLASGESVEVANSSDPSRGAGMLHAPQGGETQSAGYDDGLTPSQRAGVLWDQMKNGISQWWSQNWPMVVAGAAAAVAVAAAAIILTGGSIVAVVGPLMTAMAVIAAGAAIAKAAGFIRSGTSQAWNGNPGAGSKDYGKAAALLVLEFALEVLFKPIGKLLKGLRAASKAAMKGAQRAGKAIVKGLRAGTKVAKRGVGYVIRGGKVVLKGVSGAIARGAKSVRKLGERLLAKTRFKRFTLEPEGKWIVLYGVFNPKTRLGQFERTVKKGAPRRGALKDAKRDLGIPKSQHPVRVERVRMTDKSGKVIRGKDGKPIMTREYTYKRPDGSKVVVQEHSVGHRFGEGGVGDQGPHFNVRPLGNTRTGKVPGTKGHYSF